MCHSAMLLNRSEGFKGKIISLDDYRFGIGSMGGPYRWTKAVRSRMISGPSSEN